MVREKKGSVKISELDNNNRDVDRDSSESTNRRTPGLVGLIETSYLRTQLKAFVGRFFFCEAEDFS